VDPGSTVTGYGVVERRGNAYQHLAHGTIRTGSTAPLPERLATIVRRLREVVTEYTPGRAVVERVFVSVNVRSALVLGQSRGAILSVLGEEGVPVDEFAAREIKKAVTGVGSADKHQVRAMVIRLLALESPPALDASDALAMALCRAQMGRMADLAIAPRRSSRARRRPNLRGQLDPQR
jgi:crossover junction endodeoxyribonuclease RuvC